QRVGERRPDRSRLVADQEVDVGDLVPFADEGLADVHHDVAGHGRSLRKLSRADCLDWVGAHRVFARRGPDPEPVPIRSRPGSVAAQAGARTRTRMCSTPLGVTEWVTSYDARAAPGNPDGPRSGFRDFSGEDDCPWPIPVVQ